MDYGMRAAIWLVVGATLAVPRGATATWSITAVDPRTRQVGIALASCIGGGDISEAGALVPGVGVVAAQASTNDDGRRLAVELLASGATPTEVVEKISSRAFDPQPLFSWLSGRETRQYGVVALGFENSPATFTGSRTIGWAGSLHGSGVSVQGNILPGAEVAGAVLSSYERTGACALPDRLMLALEAGAAAGGARRCVPELSARAAFLEVAWPDDPLGESSLRIVVNNPEDTSGILRFFRQMLRKERRADDWTPVRALREQFDRWQLERGGALGSCQPVDASAASLAASRSS
jgi:uncharacterized Ntn-hydrolase superfamily protein